MTTPHEQEQEARERVVRPQPNHEMANAYAQELCIDAMHDGTLKGNLASAYLALKQENLDLWTELEMARFILKHSLGSEAKIEAEWADSTRAIYLLVEWMLMDGGHEVEVSRVGKYFTARLTAHDGAVTKFLGHGESLIGAIFDCHERSKQ